MARAFLFVSLLLRQGDVGERAPVHDGVRGARDGALCVACAASDYYKRVEHGERIWPWLARRMPGFLRSTPALAVVAVVALGCHVAIAVQA